VALLLTVSLSLCDTEIDAPREYAPLSGPPTRPSLPFLYVLIDFVRIEDAATRIANLVTVGMGERQRSRLMDEKIATVYRYVVKQVYKHRCFPSIYSIRASQAL
jgi:hypothetical protein